MLFALITVRNHLLESYDHIAKLLDAGVPTDMILLEISIAFDKVFVKSDLQSNYMLSSLKRSPCSGSLMFFMCDLYAFGYLMNLAAAFFLRQGMF